MIAQNVAEIVSRHVKLTVEGIDRMYLNVFAVASSGASTYPINSAGLLRIREIRQRYSSLEPGSFLELERRERGTMEHLYTPDTYTRPPRKIRVPPPSSCLNFPPRRPPDLAGRQLRAIADEKG